MWCRGRCRCRCWLGLGLRTSSTLETFHPYSSKLGFFLLGRRHMGHVRIIFDDQRYQRWSFCHIELNLTIRRLFFFAHAHRYSPLLYRNISSIWYHQVLGDTAWRTTLHIAYIINHVRCSSRNSIIYPRPRFWGCGINLKDYLCLCCYVMSKIYHYHYYSLPLMHLSSKEPGGSGLWNGCVGVYFFFHPTTSTTIIHLWH